jgi:hypothetical protein
MPRTRSRRRPKAGRPKKFTDKAIIAALKEKKGSVYLAADVVGCVAQTIYDRAKTSEAVRNAINHQQGMVNDIAELVIFQNLLSDDKHLAQRAAEFRLTRMARDRGYGDKLDLSHSGKVETDLDLTPEQREAMLTALATKMANLSKGKDE